MAEEFRKVAKREEIKPNELTLVDVGETQVILTELNGSVIAFDNMCTHEECDLIYGAIDEENEIECDCHGTRYNVLSGAVTMPPAEIPLPIYQVEVDGNDVSVGPKKN
jgi:nitrite reductase/ring-hydroxylating ferredoxin subunit